MSNINTEVITREDRVKTLEDIAKSYLEELNHSLYKLIAHRLSDLPNREDSAICLEVKEMELRGRIESLKYKLGKIDAL